jgi:Gpi18-like mannosyltransferase
MPRWAIIAAAGVALNPAVILISAWWGQYDSIYTAFALVAIVLAVEGHVVAGGAAVALAAMTKPQGLPFILPYSAWVAGRSGIRGLLAVAGTAAVVVALLWLPFVTNGGPTQWVGSVQSLQTGSFAIATLNAWNLWGVVQGFVAGDVPTFLIPDSARIVGPITVRMLGFGLAGALMLVLAIGMARRPSHAALVVGMTAGALVAFTFLPTMHERYLFPVAVIPLPLIWWRPARLLWLALSAAFFAELIWSLQATYPFVGLGSGLDVLRIPVAAFIVIVATESVAAVFAGRLPGDHEWDRALGRGPRPDVDPVVASSGVG